MDYPFGRLAIWLLKGVCWTALIGGIVIAFAGAGGSLYSTFRQEFGLALPASFFSTLAGILITLLAMVALAFLDHIAATIDTAVWTRKGVRVSQQQLAISKEILRINKKTLEVQNPQVALQHEQEDDSGRKRGLLGLLSRPRKSPAPADGPGRHEPAFTGVEGPRDDGNRQLGESARTKVAIAGGNGSDQPPLQHPIGTEPADVSAPATAKE